MMDGACKKTKINKAAVAVIIVLFLVGCTAAGFLTGFFTDMYDKLFLGAPSRSDVSYPVWAFFTALEKNDVDYIKKAAPEGNEKNKEYVQKKLASFEETARKTIESKRLLSYEIVRIEDMTDIGLEEYKNRYDGVTYGKMLTVSVTMEKNGEKETSSISMPVIIQDGSWKFAF